jgi:hypothetical protein
MWRELRTDESVDNDATSVSGSMAASMPDIYTDISVYCVILSVLYVLSKVRFNVRPPMEFD